MIGRLRGELYAGPIEATGPESLTPREAEVMRSYIRQGDRTLAARELGISLSTIRNHLSVIYRRLGVTSAVQAVIIFDRWERDGVLTWPDTDRRAGERRSGVDRRAGA